jgi:putative addiction module killer protein
MGNFGDNKSVGDGVYELRIHMRSGIRIYYMRRGIEVVVLLAGGNKDSQKKDIEIARKLSARIKDE